MQFASTASPPKGPEKATHVFAAGEANFESDVLQASQTTPVLVDFWATWCGPCKALGPILEKLADDYAGAFLLAKVDCDQEQRLAGMFGVRSIPTVALIRDGQIADAFSGALPEAQVREFLTRHQIEPASRVQAAGGATDIAEDASHAEAPEAAVARLEKAVAADPNDAAVKLDLALARARTGATAGVQATLDALPAELVEDDRAKALGALLAMQRSLAGMAPAAELLARVERDPRDFAAHDALGVRKLLGGDPAAATQHWLAILGADRGWHDGLARQRLLDAFRIVPDEALVAAARRQMSSLLF